MKAIILARGSTKAQEEGHSIAAQRLRLVDYCARKGLKVIKTYELVESSTRGERKEFAAMLAFAQAQNETVAIVADAVDRFQRSFKESVLICDQLIRKEKVELHFHQEGTIIGKGASSMVASAVENRRFGCAETYKPPNPLRRIRPPAASRTHKHNRAARARMVQGSTGQKAGSRRAQRHWFESCGFFRSYPARRSINFTNFPEVIFQCLSKPSDFLPP